MPSKYRKALIDQILTFAFGLSEILKFGIGSFEILTSDNSITVLTLAFRNSDF